MLEFRSYENYDPIVNVNCNVEAALYNIKILLVEWNRSVTGSLTSKAHTVNCTWLDRSEILLNILVIKIRELVSPDIGWNICT